MMEGDTSEREVPYEVDPEWIPAMQSDDLMMRKILRMMLNWKRLMMS